MLNVSVRLPAVFIYTQMERGSHPYWIDCVVLALYSTRAGQWQRKCFGVTGVSPHLLQLGSLRGLLRGSLPAAFSENPCPSSGVVSWSGQSINQVSWSAFLSFPAGTQHAHASRVLSLISIGTIPVRSARHLRYFVCLLASFHAWVPELSHFALIAPPDSFSVLADNLWDDTAFIAVPISEQIAIVLSDTVWSSSISQLLLTAVFEPRFLAVQDSPGALSRLKSVAKNSHVRPSSQVLCFHATHSE